MYHPSTLLLFVLLAGLALGFAFPIPDSQLPAPYNVLASLLGWCYTTAWSVSFYPQVLLNWRRRSVTGLSFDFLGLNFVGWLCYSAFNVALYAFPRQVVGPSDDVRRLVELNDVVFALHALAVTGVTVAQCLVYERGNQRLSRATRVLVVSIAIVLVSYGAAVLTVGCQKCAKMLSWLSFVYFLSYVKMAISLVKYTPQLYFNFQRRSTVGWNVDNIILDLAGGLLSVGQVTLTCHVLRDWSPLLGNPVKFGLGLISIMFDVAFLLQHYVLYPEPLPKPPAAPPPARRPLDARPAAAAAAAAAAMPATISSLLEEGRVHSVCAILRHLVQHPELLPNDVCEQMCCTYAEHGIDVDVARVLAHFASHPDALQPQWVGSICCHCGTLVQIPSPPLSRHASTAGVSSDAAAAAGHGGDDDDDDEGPPRPAAQGGGGSGGGLTQPLLG